MKKYFPVKYIIPTLIILGALALYLLLRPNVFKKFHSAGQIEFTKGSELVHYQETNDRLRGRFKIPPAEVAQFEEKNELEHDRRRSPHDDIIKERCSDDRLRKVNIRFNETMGMADIDILEMAKYPGLNCLSR